MNKQLTKRMLGGIVFFVLLTLSCGKEEEPPEIVRPVRYQPVYASGGSRTRSFTGVAQAGLESQLSFRVPGTVENVAVKVGDEVRAGQLIAKLDASDYSLQAQQAEASLAQMEAQSRNVDANYERLRALYENNNASRTDLDAARAAAESGKAAVQAAEKQLELARLQESYTRLTAPTGGAIAEVLVENNENVKTGTPIAVLTSGKKLEVRVSIPDILITRIEEGQTAEVVFDALPDSVHKATVTEVGVAATGVVTTFPVTVSLDRHEEGVRPGMTASVSFRFESQDERERFLVPEVAGIEDRDGRFVYVVEALPDDPGFGIVHRRAVTVGELTAEGLEVFEGLSDGELLVTAGISRIEDGQRVRLK